MHILITTIKEWVKKKKDPWKMMIGLLEIKKGILSRGNAGSKAW